MSSKQLKDAKRLRPGWNYNKALGLFYRGGRSLSGLGGSWCKSKKPESTPLKS